MNIDPNWIGTSRSNQSNIQTSRVERSGRIISGQCRCQRRKCKGRKKGASRPRLHVEAPLPLHVNSLSALELVGIEKLSKLPAMFMNESGDLNVEATVLGYFDHPLFPPPLDRVDATSGFSDAQSRLSNVLQPWLDTHRLFDLNQQIERSQLVRKIQDRVAH